MVSKRKTKENIDDAKNKFFKAFEKAFHYSKKAWNEAMHFNTKGEEIEVLGRIINLEVAGNTEINPSIKSLYYKFAGMISGEIGVTKQDVVYLQMAMAYFRFVDSNTLAGDSKYQYFFRKGRNLFYLQKLEKKISVELELEFDYYQSVITYLLPAQNLLQICFKEGIVERKLVSQANRNYILLHMSYVAAELNRWIEFHYYLNFIPILERDASFYIMDAFNLEAYYDFTHCSKYSALTTKIIEVCKKCLEFNLPAYNKKPIEEILNKHVDIAKYYGSQLLLHKSFKYNHSKYRRWCLDNNLTLNEHSLYCDCENSKRDNLMLKTSHPHTKKKWLWSFQILIEQLKFDFDKVRLNFYNATQENVSLANSRSVQSKFKDSNLYTSFRSRLLIESFKGTYSILDRIAVAFVSIFDDLTDKPIYFHDLADRLKNKTSIKKNKYVIAIESIAYEINHQSENATLNEYKIWRDAIEHNFFYLIKDNATISEVSDKYSNLNRVSFANIHLFTSRTEHFMQLCKSAILTLCFLLREETCLRYYDHKRNAI